MIAFRLISRFSRALRVNSDVGCGLGDRHWTDDVCCEISRIKDCFESHWNLNFTDLRILLDHWDYLKGQIYVLSNPIAHYVEFSVWRNKCDTPIFVEPAQSNTLMELYVIDLHSLALLCWLLVLHLDSVVNPKFTLRHSRELRATLDHTFDVCLQHSATCRQLYVDRLYDVNVNLIFPVENAFSPPRNSACRSHSDLLKFLNIWELSILAACPYELL